MASSEQQLQHAKLLESQGQIEAALHELYRILETEPACLPAVYQIANMLIPRGRLAEARKLIELARAIHPQDYGLLLRYAVVQHACGETEEALAALEVVEEAGGSLAPKAGSLFLMQMAYLPDVTAEDILEASAQWEARYAPPKPAPVLRKPEGRIRVGYYSPDFRTHSIASFIPPLLKHHDREHFEVYLYSDTHHADRGTVAFKACGDHWRNLCALKSAEAIPRIQADKLDLMVDLSGHFGDARPWLFAARLAQRQVHLVGYNGTTGLRTIDYRLSDPICDPPGTEHLSSEQIIRLDPGFHLYKPLVRDIEPGALPCEARGGVTFGSFSNRSKINSEVIALWSEVLKAVPQSRLLIKAPQLRDKQVREELLALFIAQGVDSGQIEILPGTPSQVDHLRHYRSVDIALDTFPLNGTTTICEALWMGVPVLTLKCDRHSSRVGASLLQQVGMENGITYSREEFVQRAVDWSRNPRQLAQWRQSLRGAVEARLGDVEAYTRRIESAYLSMLATG